MLVDKAAGESRHRSLAIILIVLVCGLVGLLAPVAASAETIVDSTADEVDAVPGGACNTAANKCTLRAAIEVTNLNPGADEIFFDLAVFKGDLGSMIALGSALPTITSPVALHGFTCTTASGSAGPCTGISAPSGQPGLTVEADNTTIDRLAITGASTAIDVINAASGFTAESSWIGVKLDGTAGPNGGGIFLDPNSDGAVIGGTTAAERNVFGNNSGVALDLEGASHALIEGNYFGVGPNGATLAANGKDIEISDSTAGAGFKAESNEVGAPLGTVAAETPECDGACNVISGASRGIDLQGDGAGQNEAPATGSTFIKGNFVGLNAAGTGVVANSGYGIYVGGADHVTVGGYSAGEGNYVAGGAEGIASGEGGEDFVVRGNRIGYGSDGSNVTPPTTVGILGLALSVNEAPSIEVNKVRMLGGFGIKSLFETGHVTGNEVVGGGIGIITRVGEGAGLIASNLVEAQTEHGIVVESPENDIRANEVVGSGESGILVLNSSGVAMTGNLVGGSSAERENVIEGSGGAAIEIREEASEPGSQTEIARNRGSANAGLFIDLVAGANEGIGTPSVSTALQSSATGVALPNATVRVFSKAGPAAGELKGFIGQVKADASGNWKLTISPALPTGTLVTATQTNAFGATSELAGPAAVSADPVPPPPTCPAAGPPACPVVEPPPPVPNTKIKSGPKAKSAATTAKFKFTSTVARSTFQCKLDKGKFKKCSSPKTYKKLKPGKHVFKVRAIGPTGLVDASPAKRTFTVLDQ